MGHWLRTTWSRGFPRTFQVSVRVSTRFPSREARVHALTLGLLITRLRAKHGSMAEARDAWAHEADARLNALDMPALQVQLLRPAKQALALNEMRELLRMQDHELLRILMETLGWD